MNKICIKCDVRLFLCPRLSGEYPFQGNNDAETLALVTAASYEFDEESFEDISEHAKDFIRSLLKKDRRCAKTTPKKKITVFVTVHGCYSQKFYLVHYLMQLIMSHQSKIFVVTFAAYLHIKFAYLSWNIAFALLYLWLSRCRLSCTEALVHPWMILFTPLTRRSTKSLNKEKMRRFLAKRKWKVKYGLCRFSYLDSVMTFQGIVRNTSPVISFVMWCDLSF